MLIFFLSEKKVYQTQWENTSLPTYPLIQIRNNTYKIKNCDLNNQLLLHENILTVYSMNKNKLKDILLVKNGTTQVETIKLKGSLKFLLVLVKIRAMAAGC